MKSAVRVSLLAFCLMGVLPLAAQVAPPENMVVEGAPPVPEALVEALLPYQNIRTAGLAHWHPQERAVLISTRFGNTTQLYRVDAPGGMRRQLTFYDEPATGGAFCRKPEQRCLLFRRDVGGAENYQLYRLDLDTARATLLSDGRFRTGGYLQTNAGDAIVYTSVKRTGRDYDLYWLNPLNPSSEKRLLEVKGAWAPLDFSPDDRRLLVGQYISINESYLHVLDLETGALETLTPRGEEKVAYAGGKWSADGKSLYVVTDKESEFRRLAVLDPETGEHTYLTSEIPWDVEEFDLSDDGRYLVFAVNENGLSRLHLRDLRTGEAPAASALPPGILNDVEFRRGTHEFAFELSSARVPTDVYSYDLKSGKLTRWTESETGGLDPMQFAEAELVTFPTFDTVNGEPRMISAWVYLPPAPFKPPYPVLLDIHGGPESQARPGFRGRANYYTSEMGIAVIRPNVRGSSGYGKSFLQLDNGRLREDSVRDLGALLDWIAEEPYLAAERVCVSGGSYGGYMTLASMVHYNERLRCAIDRVGISKFVTFLENTQDYRRDLRRVEYGDERDPEMREFLISVSPLTHAEKITKPLLVAQGLNDPRVPASESEQMVERILGGGGSVWYLLAKDEGHGFGKKPNQDYLQYAVILFLEKYLLE